MKQQTKKREGKELVGGGDDWWGICVNVIG